ncbi:MAG TPA: O-antigen ligase family protein [Burkholderiales bacterium]|nr:O-antigen ligase family protein [Burkholderiales bacterium]
MSLVLERRAFPGLAALGRRCAAVFCDDGSSPRNTGSSGGSGLKPSGFAGIALLGIVWGFVVAITGLNALFLAAALFGCAFIVRDFRVGVVLIILLLPISNSSVFPHAMLGVTGLNPINPLLVGTLVSYLLQGLFDGSLRRFMPRPLLWLYIVPILVAGAVGGSLHFRDIPPSLFKGLLEFDDMTGYFRDLVVKPLLMVIFALLVGAAVSRSEKPERFLVPMLISIWVMVSLVIVFVLLSGTSLREMSSSESRELLTPLGMHANELGRMYVTAYGLLLFTWAEARSPGLRLALFASMGLVGIALLLTFSRGAFLGFIVVNVLFLLWRRNAKTLILFGLLAMGALLLLPEAVYDRVTTGFGHGAADPVAISAGRIEYIWLPLLPEIPKSPIFGHGLGSILWSEPMRRGAGVAILAVGHPHNAYLQALLDMGVVGLILLCAYFVHVWKGFRALSVDPALDPILRGFYAGAAAGLVSLLISYFTDSSLMPVPEQVFLWLAIGMMYGERARGPVRVPGRGS